MKKLVFLLGLLLVCTAVSSAQYENYGGVGVSFNIFYSSLNSYGEWIPVEGNIYGWRPVGVAVGWRPYMYGRWAWTSDGWYWVSDEPWGWAVFHYGRWYYDDYYGWIWIPGYDWAPAWVEWRYGGPYVGWAPLSPYAIFQIGVGIHYSEHWVTPHSYWAYADCRYLTSPSLHRYVYRKEYNTRYFGMTRAAGDVRYDKGRIITRGPERTYIEQRGNVRIPQTEIVDARERGQERIVNRSGREEIEAYRPKIDAQTRVEMTERPSRVREDGRKVTLDATRTDMGVRGAAVETNRESTRDVETRQRIERAPAVESNATPKIERRQEQPQAPVQRNVQQQVETRQRTERAPAAEPKAAPKVEKRKEQSQAPAQRNIQQRRDAMNRSQAQPQQRVAPAQRERVQKEGSQAQNAERVARTPAAKREVRAAEPQRSSGRSESGTRGGRRER